MSRNTSFDLYLRWFFVTLAILIVLRILFLLADVPLPYIWGLDELVGFLKECAIKLSEFIARLSGSLGIMG